MGHERPDPDDTAHSAQVLRFRPRAEREPAGRASTPGRHEVELDGDLAQYEEEDVHIDYRHRMLMNVIALAVVAMLVGFGVWITDTVRGLEKDQDCVLQGRQNCAPIDLPATQSRR